ncbi:MAG: J domain-containing protein [Bacteroidetes bacterium]|nr:J domain-containing protein [Bacteroidota bacterium]
MITEYYKILGVSPQASLQEIKTAYRAKAKKLHPDVNPSANAHQQFVLLNKAYAYICDVKSGKIKPYAQPHKPNPHQNTQTHTYRAEHSSQQQWQNSERAKAYAKAKYAKEKREAEASAQFDKYLGIGFIIWVAYTAIKLIFYPLSSSNVFGIFLLIFIAYRYRNKLKKIAAASGFTNINSIWEIAVKTINTPFFSMAFSLLFSIVTFFTIALNTLIPLHITIIIYVSAFLLPMAFAELTGKSKNNILRSFIFPLSLNLLFLINYNFSSNPAIEQYDFYFDTEKAASYGQEYHRETSFIYLEGNAYDNFIGIRLFSDFNQMAGKQKVALQLEDGLFGIKVLKEFDFFNPDDLNYF